MSYHAVTHVALRVADLRAAELFYGALFELTVAFREAEVAGEWRALPPGAGWADAEAAQIQLGLVMLTRDVFHLALEAADTLQADGSLSHIGLHVDAAELERLRASVARLECALVLDRPTIIVFDDRYGVRWEITTTPYTDPARQSSGAHLGRWLWTSGRGAGGGDQGDEELRADV